MKSKLCCLCICLMLFLTSCWDERLLKEAKLVSSASADLETDKTILFTATIRTVTQETQGTKDPASTNIIIKSKATSLSDSRSQITRKIAGEFAISKSRVLLLGEELAKEDIYPMLDILYRDPRSSLGAMVVIAKGRAEEIINLKTVEETLVSDEIQSIISTAENNTVVSIENVQSICPIIFDPGEDLTLPLIEKDKEKFIHVLGIALFNGHKYTGYDLIKDEPILFLLLNDQKKKFAKFTLNVNPKEKDMRERYVSVLVKKNNPKMNLKISKDNHITVDFNLKLKVEILEYPKDKLADPKEIKKLNKRMSEELTKKADKIMLTLQKANCDGFGIGRELMAFHPKEWKKLDWNKDYQKIKINPKVNVEIVETGIIK